jgi:hypothetical protein
MTIYSAHDTTVFSLLAALGATETAHLPGYTAHIVAELWESRADCEEAPSFSVRLQYDDTVLKDAAVCKGGHCTLQDLLKATKQITMDPKDCNRPSSGVNHLFEPGDSQCCATETM